MSTQSPEFDVPTWLAGVVAVFAAGALAYGILVRGSLESGVSLLVGALSIVLSLFVVYLLYRFVLAVETIAEKL
jgi:uncharacterized membrane protein